MNTEIQQFLAQYRHLICTTIVHRFEHFPDESHYSFDFTLQGNLRFIVRDYRFPNGRRKYSYHLQDSMQTSFFVMTTNRIGLRFQRFRITNICLIP
jgi:hypothetical protein